MLHDNGRGLSLNMWNWERARTKNTSWEIHLVRELCGVFHEGVTGIPQECNGH